MKTTVDTIAIYSASMRSLREPITILSVGEECSYEGQDGKMHTGKILEISTNGHCWIEHERKVYAVPYSHIHEKRR